MLRSKFLGVIVFSVFLGLFGVDVHSQAQKKRFQIVSYSVDGTEMTNFDIFFLINGKCISPERINNIVLVPFEVQKASSKSSGIRFVSSNLDFTFDNLAFRGYEDTDEIKSDYKIEASTSHPAIERHMDQISDKSKRDMGIISSQDICGVFSLTRLPRLRENSILIADPVTITKVQRCEKR